MGDNKRAIPSLPRTNTVFITGVAPFGASQPFQWPGEFLNSRQFASAVRVMPDAVLKVHGLTQVQLLVEMSGTDAVMNFLEAVRPVDASQQLSKQFDVHFLVATGRFPDRTERFVGLVDFFDALAAHAGRQLQGEGVGQSFGIVIVQMHALILNFHPLLPAIDSNSLTDNFLPSYPSSMI